MKQRSLVGKIAALPYDIREQLNRRLRDGQTAPLILPWLNALPAVQKILADQFSGAPVNGQNLCNWRASGYQRWLQIQPPFTHPKENLTPARHFTRAACGIASGVAALAADQLFKSLQPDSGEKIPDDHLLKVFSPVTALIKTEQNHLRLKLAKRRACQKDAQLLLRRDKHQRDTAAVVLRSVHDDRVHLIEAAPISDEEKIELVGLHLYGQRWEPRRVLISPQLPVLPEYAK